MSNRDTRRLALRERLEAAGKVNAPLHAFRESSYSGACIVCGLEGMHPVHNTVADADTQEYTGVMIALFPSTEVAAQLAVKGGEAPDQLHVTLAYLGDKSNVTNVDELMTVVSKFATGYGPLAGSVSGMGVFSNTAGAVTYASVDVPQLPDFRHALVGVVEAAGFVVAKDHGYTPHMTLAYADQRNIKVSNVAITFDAITVASGGERTSYALCALDDVAEEARKKPAPGKHHYMHPEALRGVGYYGGGFCAACGRPASDPDHDGDVDAPGDVEPESAVGGSESVSTDDDDGPSSAPIDRKRSKKANKPHDYKNPVPADKVDKNDTSGFLADCDLCGQPANAIIHGQTGVDDLLDATSIVATVPKLRPVIEYLGGDANAVPQTRPYTDYTPQARPYTQGSSEENAQLREALILPTTRAFVTDVAGHTLITGPASTFVNAWETALTPNPHMMWMQGNFVGGEKANRNGAFWNTGDLEMGEPTVRYGPLNWLHEARHVIGVLADSKLKLHDEQAAQALTEPYIQVAAGIWKWIYPDEAEVVQQASDQERLWYSMECISAQVECVGENSCGAIADYGDYVHQTGPSCRHMAERSATRRFVNPTFLGGAVIVPPVRPGWTGADARVMQQASEMAERAFDQAGNPDIPASTWEQMMQSVISYAVGL
jgi:2'-5' RNA ligase